MNNLCDQSKLRIVWMRPSLQKTNIMAIDEWSSPNPWTEEQFDQIAKSKNLRRVVLTPKNTVLGFIVYRNDSTYYEIIKIVVDMSYQRLGIGSMMMNDLKRHSSSDNPVKSICMKIPRDDQRSRRFLTSCEFTIMAEAHDHITMRWRRK